jgi:ABC-2 type transport system permease protein
MKRAAHLFKMNPIIVKELRSRMRGARAFITLTIILLVMGGALYGMLQIILANSRYSTVLSPQIGQAMFATLVFLELFMIAAITPAVTSGAISSEKEKQTYEMLMATPMSPSAILWGKLVSALSYVLILLFAGIPLASLVFIFGGVAPGDMLKALLVLVSVAITFGVLGLFMSALFGRTGRATVASFVVVALLMVGPLFAAVLASALRNGAEPPRLLLAPSPISTLSAALASSMGQNGAGGIFWALGGLFNMGISPVSQTSIPRPLYHYSLPIYALISVVLYMITTRLVQPTRRWRIRRRELLTGLAVLAVMVGAIVGGYYATASRYEWNRTNTNGQRIEPVMVGPMNGVAVQVAPAYPAMIATPTPVTVEEQQSFIATATTAALLNPPPTPTPPAILGPAALDAVQQATVYALVTRELFTAGNTATLYLVGTTDDSVSKDPHMPQGEPVAISQETRERITALLGDLGNIVWVNSADEIKLDPKTGAIDGGAGAKITFGNIYAQEGGGSQVSASLYFNSQSATGKTYMLGPDGKDWKILGTTWVWIY